MIFNFYNYFYIKMGSGNSRYVEDQERFVRQNYQQYRNVISKDIGQLQIEGKLRQLYASSDECDRNRNAYILSYDWKTAKSKVSPIYESSCQANGQRRW